MFRLIFRTRLWASNAPKYRLQNYSNEDYATMCGLLKEKYFLNNEEIQSSGLIKLLDDAGKVIGIYTASEARKKAQTLGLDMVLVTMKTSPIVCKVSDFRNRLIHKFYQDIVQKRQKQLLQKATSIKSLKISPNLNKDEMGLKLKQLVELSLKNMKVRVIMHVSQNNEEQCLSKLEWIKSQLLNKCYIQEEISNKRFEEKGKDYQKEVNKKQANFKIYSFVIRARQANFPKNLQEKTTDYEAAIKNFLKKYYQQDDGEMMDLKSAGLFEIDTGIEIKEQIAKSLPSKPYEEEKGKKELEADILRQAQARVLNSRLKQLLSFYQ